MSDDAYMMFWSIAPLLIFGMLSARFMFRGKAKAAAGILSFVVLIVCVCALFAFLDHGWGQLYWMLHAGMAAFGVVGAAIGMMIGFGLREWRDAKHQAGPNPEK